MQDRTLLRLAQKQVEVGRLRGRRVVCRVSVQRNERVVTMGWVVGKSVGCGLIEVTVRWINAWEKVVWEAVAEWSASGRSIPKNGRR